MVGGGKNWFIKFKGNGAGVVVVVVGGAKRLKGKPTVVCGEFWGPEVVICEEFWNPEVVICEEPWGTVDWAEGQGQLKFIAPFGDAGENKLKGKAGGGVVVQGHIPWFWLNIWFVYWFEFW